MKNLGKRIVNLVRAAWAYLVSKPQTPPHCGNINHLLLHLCDFDYELHAWVLRWLAYPLRNPGAKMERGLIVNGGEGTGKTMFFQHVMAQIYGDASRHIGERKLASAFTPWMPGARYIVVAGILSRNCVPALKQLVSSQFVTVNQQGLPAYAAENEMNFVFLADSDNFVPPTLDQRRFVVIEAPPKREPRFYRAVADEINNGGVHVFRDYLMHHLDMEGFTQYSTPPEAPPPGGMREAA